MNQRYETVTQLIESSELEDSLKQEITQRISERTFMKRLIVCRVSANISQEELADRVGWELDYLKQLEESKDSLIPLVVVREYLNAIWELACK